MVSTAVRGALGTGIERVNWRTGLGQLASTATKWRAAGREAAQLFGLAPSWVDRLRIARFMTELYVARALPVDTYGWDTSIRLRGSHYSVGLRTSEIYVLEEVFGYRLYDQLADYVPREDWIFFDVGANVGIVSVLQAERGAKVYAFEPNPDCFRRLLRNVVGNGLEARIQAFNLALGDHVHEAAMCVAKGGTTGGTVVASDGVHAERSPRVTVTTLDSMAASVGVSKIDLLKIDVEGAELEVLRGGGRTLAMTDRIILEYHSRPLLRAIGEWADGTGFICERKMVYFPEIAAVGRQEVGIVYLRRVRNTAVVRERRIGLVSSA